MPHPLLELMRRGESGAAGYNAYNRGTYTDSHGKERIRPGTPPIDFASLTVGQVMDLQAAGPRDPDRVFALGKYQVIPRTMRGAVAALHIDRDEQFTPALQDRIFTDYLITQKRPSIQGYIVGRAGVTLEQAQHELACEWASFGDPRRNGASHYGGANHASITLQQSADALNQMRTQYQQAIAHGATPAQAWRDVTGGSATQTPPSPAPAAQHPANPLADGVLRQGEHGAPVLQLQQRLNRLGVRDAKGRALGEDGDFGTHTLEAVIAFQRSHGLEGRGVVGPKTMQALAAAEKSHAQPTPQAPPSPRTDGAAVHLDAAYRMGVEHDGVKYRLGAKDLSKGFVDCSGWVRELQNATMAEINRETGRAVFAPTDRFPNQTSDQMIERASQRSGVLLTNPLRAEQLREGMIIGEDNGPHRWEPAGRFHGIDHITMVVRNPQTQELMISQSRGGEGVEMIPLQQYLDGKQSHGVKLFATDPLQQARSLLEPTHAATQAPVRAVDEPTRASFAAALHPVAGPTRTAPASQPRPAGETPRGASADGVLSPGEHGPDVARLQTLLNRLGYTDASRHALPTNGLYGRETGEAVRAFQLDNGLEGKGMAGPKTQAALARAEAGLMTYPGHPQNAQFEQTLKKVHEAEARAGIKPGVHSEKLAGALVVELVREGITRVDRVELNDTGTLARVVQAGARDEPALNRVTDAINVQQAMGQPVAESSRQAHQVAVNVQTQLEDRQRQHAPVSTAAPAPAPAPAM